MPNFCKLTIFLYLQSLQRNRQWWCSSDIGWDTRSHICLTLRSHCKNQNSIPLHIHSIEGQHHFELTFNSGMWVIYLSCEKTLICLPEAKEFQWKITEMQMIPEEISLVIVQLESLLVGQSTQSEALIDFLAKSQSLLSRTYWVESRPEMSFIPFGLQFAEYGMSYYLLSRSFGCSLFGC